jgi:hypothetical protein
VTNQTTPVHVPDRNALKGQYIRNNRDNTIYRIADVGKRGITAYEASGFEGPTSGPEVLITWRAMRKIYHLMVHAADIDTKGGGA